MAIDHGLARIGIAMCDPDETIASPYEVWRNEGSLTARRLAALTREESVEAIVVGLPRHHDGTESATAGAVREFAGWLEAELAATPGARPAPLPITFWNESLTSVEADRILAERGVRPMARKKILDAVAAALILEDLIASRRDRGLR